MRFTQILSNEHHVLHQLHPTIIRNITHILSAPGSMITRLNLIANNTLRKNFVIRMLYNEYALICLNSNDQVKNFRTVRVLYIF